MINEAIRNYEVSIWTLQDEFITTLKWPNLEHKGEIENPKLTLNVDGTRNFTFTLPMYVYRDGELVENPLWYNTRNGNIAEGMRKIKVIFNKTLNDVEEDDWQNIFDKAYIPSGYHGNVDLHNRKLVEGYTLPSSLNANNSYYTVVPFVLAPENAIRGKYYSIILDAINTKNNTISSKTGLEGYWNNIYSQGTNIEEWLVADKQNQRHILNIQAYDTQAAAQDAGEKWANELLNRLYEWDRIRKANNWFGYNIVEVPDADIGEPTYIYYKQYTLSKNVFEFLITKVTETHEGDILTCQIDCEGLAFHELGKRGYNYDLSSADFELKYKEWQEAGANTEDKPHQNVQFWCEKIGLEPLPICASDMEAAVWYYDIQMDYTSSSDDHQRATNIVYEDPVPSEWTVDQNTGKLRPQSFIPTQEKERSIEVKESNIYNITQTIAEKFEIYCRYDYGYDDNYHIISRKVVFYNNYLHEDDIFSLTYPYSSKKISREMDSANVTTKLFVRPSEDYTTLMGEMNICLSEANPTQENYIFNFDYLKDTNNITAEQAAAITKHEAELNRINNELYPLENKISYYSNQKTDLEAKLTFYENSIDLDDEQINTNQDYINSITKSDGTENNTVESRDENNPEPMIITTDEQNNYCIKLRDKKKGIHADSVHLYRQYNKFADPKFPPQITVSSTTQTGANSGIGSATTIPNEITDFYFKYDEYGNPERIYGVSPLGSNAEVYMTYTYEPILYYRNVIAIWTEKKNNDTILRNKIDAELNNPIGGNPPGIIALLNKAQEDYDALLEEKRELVKKFERFMGPALREGYWQPEDYKDYGQLYENTGKFTKKFDSRFAESITGTRFSVGWDKKLFDEEQDIFYYSDINGNKTYYPMVRLDGALNIDFSKIKDYSFIFNNNYYRELTPQEQNRAAYTRIFSVGSEAILGFIEPGSNQDIMPVLILVGAKNMTNDQISHMLDASKGHPRLGIVTTNIENNSKVVNLNITNTITLDPSQYIITGNSNMSAVYPRIKFSSLMLKTNTSDLFIRYKGNLLQEYQDYIVRTRHISSGTYAPEYLITLKAESLLKTGTNIAQEAGNMQGYIKINYILSNASTAIYADALKVSKENAYPKVSYTIDPNILSKSLLRNLHQKLNWLVMINDTQLKFKNVFGYISKMELDLDFPDQDTIEIKNYKTKFEDLFSTIVAQTESMKHNEGLLSALAGGTYCLQDTSAQSLLENNSTTINEYLDEYINNSPAVKKQLEQLFTEAGEILSDANASLNYNSQLTYENATILSTFASTISERLMSHVYRSKDAPNSFHVNDIWIQIDDQDNEIKRYIATSDSSEVEYSPPLVLEEGEEVLDERKRVHNGWQVIYQGMPAGFTGAALDIDAVDGTVQILGANEVTIHGGDVNILGDRFVNIAGVSINLTSSYKQGQGGLELEELSGIHLKAVNISNSNAILSEVSIKPREITMASGMIKIGTGSINSSGDLVGTNALILNPEVGIYIGSEKGIRLFSGGAPTTTTVANVDINYNHIFFGMNNAENGNNTALEITDSRFLLAAGSVFNTLKNTSGGLALAGNIAGLEMTKEKFALAIGNNTGRSIMIMNSAGFMVGSGIDPNTAGSFVKISGGGVEIGSKGVLSVSTANFSVNANPGNGGSYFSVGDSSNYIKYKKGNTLEVKGIITATAFTLTPGATVTGLSYNSLTDKPTFEVDGVSTATWNGKKYVALTAGSQELQGLLLGVNDGKHIIAASDASTAAVDISKNGIYFDHSTDNYIHLDNTGINIQGAHIRINGEEIWERGDIMWGSTKPAHSGSRSWIWIKPNASAFITYTYSNGNNRTQDITLTVDNGESGFAATQGGNTTYYYTLTLAGKVQQPGSNAFTASVKVLASIADSTTNVIAYGPSETSGPISFPRGSGDTTGACGNITFSWSGSTNLTYGGSNNSAAKSIILHARTNYSGYAFFITYAQLTVRTSSSDAAATPCSVYYFPAGT